MRLRLYSVQVGLEFGLSLAIYLVKMYNRIKIRIIHACHIRLVILALNCVPILSQHNVNVIKIWSWMVLVLVKDNVNLIIEIPHKRPLVVSHPPPPFPPLQSHFMNLSFFQWFLRLPFWSQKLTTNLGKTNCFPIDIKLKNVAVWIIPDYYYSCHVNNAFHFTW